MLNITSFVSTILNLPKFSNTHGHVKKAKNLCETLKLKGKNGEINT